MSWHPTVGRKLSLAGRATVGRADTSILLQAQHYSVVYVLCKYYYTVPLHTVWGLLPSPRLILDSTRAIHSSSTLVCRVVSSVRGDRRLLGSLLPCSQCLPPDRALHRFSLYTLRRATRVCAI